MPDAIQKLIVDLEAQTYSVNPQNVICPMADLIAALNEIENSIGPTPGPYLPLAGGTMTGAINWSGTSTAPTLGLYANGAAQLGFAAGGQNFNLNASSFFSKNGAAMQVAVPSGTTPVFIPDFSSNSGLGRQAPGNLSLICASTEICRILATGVTIETGILTLTGGTLLATSAGLTNNAAAQVATLTNGPTAGNPTKWIPINDNGTVRNIPAW